MRDRTLIGPWIRRFLLEHLVSDRNLTHNTQASYRDTLLLLLPFDRIGARHATMTYALASTSALKSLSSSSIFYCQ